MYIKLTNELLRILQYDVNKSAVGGTYSCGFFISDTRRRSVSHKGVYRLDKILVKHMGVCRLDKTIVKHIGVCRLDRIIVNHEGMCRLDKIPVSHKGFQLS